MYGDACNTLRVLREQVLDQMYVLRKYSVEIPPYLAGWWTLTNDAAQILQDVGGCANVAHTAVGESSTSWSP